MLIHGNDGNQDSPESRMPHKTPKRILYFSDGTLEEYSSDDESDIEDINPASAAVNPSTLTWGPWVYYQTVNAGSKALAACDYMGEALAGFFGILSSRYQYEIEEFERIAAEDKEVQKENDVEMAGWTNHAQPSNTLCHQPTKLIV